MQSNRDADRYGEPKKYIMNCAKAHEATGQRCVLCTKKSEEIHHGYYGNDRVGVSTFPVCRSCHTTKCHDPKNWIPERDHMKSRNTSIFLAYLQHSYLFTAKIFSKKNGAIKSHYQRNRRKRYP